MLTIKTIKFNTSKENKIESVQFDLDGKVYEISHNYIIGIDTVIFLDDIDQIKKEFNNIIKNYEETKCIL